MDPHTYMIWNRGNCRGRPNSESDRRNQVGFWTVGTFGLSQPRLLPGLFVLEFHDGSACNVVSYSQKVTCVASYFPLKHVSQLSPFI